jgi:hypothetical protein
MKYLKEKRLFWKIKAVKILGGECNKCGYKASLAALEFHHLSNKDKCISELIQRGVWGLVERELKKCILYCSNCHREAHHSSLDWENFHFSFDFDSLMQKTKKGDRPVIEMKCLSCNETFFRKRGRSKGYCSQECAKVARRVVSRPSKEELEKLYLEEKESWQALGRKYGVSGVSVKNWAKSYGLVE